MKRAMEGLQRILDKGGTKKDIVLLAISGVALVLSLLDLPLPVDPAWVAIVLCGVPIVLEAIIGLVTALDIKADVLVSMALIASVCIGEDFAAGEVAFIMQLGSLLEDLTVARARAGIERLVKLTPRTARIVREGREEVVPAERVQAGDVLRVLPGETVPVDGAILSGETSIDQSVMTGESLPVDKGPGEEVMSGTVNRFGAFTMRASQVGEDSSLQRMIRLVQSADAGKAKIVGLADRWATWIVVAALAAAGLTWLFTREILRAVTILVVFCPCALVLATPTAIMAAIGNATRHGFLVREGDALERLAAVRRVAFDKTGTLTFGAPELAAVRPVPGGMGEEALLRLAAGVEALSEHPLGKAVVRGAAQRGLAPGAAADFAMEPGRGVSARVEGRLVLAGTPALLEARGVAVPQALEAAAADLRSQGCTLIYVAVDGAAAGLLALSDELRPSSAEMIRAVRALGVEPVLLTGDHEAAARTIAQKVGIETFRCACLPEDKLRYIGQSQEQGCPICMIGDGVNDAPALKRADVGLAMGGVGSDIAVDAADIALVSDDIRELPHLLALSRRMMRTIRINLTLSMALNFAAIALAITGVLNPVVGALVHNAGSVLVIVHSALLLGWRRRGAR
ncbi:MAG: heavy metal translocating P-type ATPase [Candidatus Spyradocola sp.]